MKKAITVLLTAIICFTFASCFDDEKVFGIVETKIVDGCYIEDLDDNMQSIYYYPDDDKSVQQKYIVNQWENIIKYSSDGKSIIAFHCVYNQFEDSEDDKFVVFDLSSENEITFETQNDFIDYCNKEKITLSDWKNGRGVAYKKIDLGNNWCVYDFDYPLNDKIMNGNEVIYEGYVFDIERKDNNCSEFGFAVPFGVEKEIPSSNNGLNVSEDIIGEYKFALFGKDKVHYYERISLNTINGDVVVIHN